MHEIRFICSFFSAARRTNQEAPPRLSGFWVRRYGRRRGLRNSLRSDSPRPFSSVFLATSPPDKGGIGDCCFCLYSNPLALRALPLYSLQEHRGRGLKVTLRSAFVGFLFSLLELFLLLRNSPPCCGTRQGEEFENVLNLSPYISLLQSTEGELKIILSDNEDCIAFSFCERPTARLSRILLLVHRGDVSFGHAAFPTVPCTLYR